MDLNSVTFPADPTGKSEFGTFYSGRQTLAEAMSVDKGMNIYVPVTSVISRRAIYPTFVDSEGAGDEVVLHVDNN